MIPTICGQPATTDAEIAQWIRGVQETPNIMLLSKNHQQCAELAHVLSRKVVEIP